MITPTLWAQHSRSGTSNNSPGENTSRYTYLTNLRVKILHAQTACTPPSTRRGGHVILNERNHNIFYITQISQHWSKHPLWPLSPIPLTPISKTKPEVLLDLFVSQTCSDRQDHSMAMEQHRALALRMRRLAFDLRISETHSMLQCKTDLLTIPTSHSISEQRSHGTQLHRLYLPSAIVLMVAMECNTWATSDQQEA